MKNKIARAATGSFVALLLASCVPASPAARIQRNPEKFEALSSDHQALVQQGQITAGMPQDAVYLAWGAPSQSFQGAQQNKLTERWDYTGSRPVTVSGFYGMDGPGFGTACYGGYGYYGLGYRMGPEIAYVPYRVASVWFVDHQVDSWERAR